MKPVSRKTGISTAPAGTGSVRHGANANAVQIPRASQQMRGQAPQPEPTDRTPTDRPSRAELVHELEVHQIELETQNDALRHTQLDLAATRDRFMDLYDFAPVGYCTLDARGIVTEANLTAAALLAIDRQDLLKRGFSRFVAPTQSDLWHRHLRQTLQSQEAQRIELELMRRGGEAFHAQLDCLAVDAAAQGVAVRITLTDVTGRQRAETDRRIATDVLDAREAERRHIARELHEELGQRLTAIKMELGSLRHRADAQSREQRVSAMLGSLDEALASVRRLAIDLRPPMLDDLGLSAAIEWLVHDAVRRLGIKVALQLQELTPAPDARLAIATYRMAQDMLHHVARQAFGSATTLSLAREDRELVLALRMQVQDGASANGHAGLDALTRNLKDRAHLIGGKLLTDLVADGKLSITARIPLGQAARHVTPPSAKERAR